MSTTQEETIELDEKALGAIVEKTKDAAVEAIKGDVDAAVEAKVKEAVAESSKEVIADYVAKTEEIERKAVEAHMKKIGAEDMISKGIQDGKFTEEVAKMSPAMRFYRQVRALDPENPNRTELTQLNEFALASQLQAKAELLKEKGWQAVEKANYGNEGVAADGGVLVPDAEFVTTVYENLPTYGVAFRYADVRQTDRTAVRVISLDSGLTFYSTAEAGVKTGAKLTFSKNEVSLQKFAVIVPATDELTDDAAVDYWNLVTREMSRAYAKKADELVFTDTTYGITNVSGVLTENVSGAGTTITWDDLLDAQAKTEDDMDESGHVWFMRKETWYRLVQTKGSTNDHYIAGSLNTSTGWVANINQPTTPWGTPVVFTRVLPSSNSVQTNDAFAVYGNLKNTLLYNKRGLALTMSGDAVVKDAGGDDFNLFTQDAKALRGVIRLLHILPNGNKTRFVVLGTGTVS